MEDLKAIWNQLGDLQTKVGQLIEIDDVESVYNKLKKEETNKKKWMPWMIPYILIMMSFIIWISEAYNGVVPMLGIALITVGALLMMHLLNKHSIPLTDYEHDKNATDFLKIVKDKLNKRRASWTIGVAVYIFFLLGGLHLLIFGIDNLVGRGGEVGLLYGVMLGLAGFSTGNMYLIHKKQYGDILKTIDRFLAK